MRAACLILAPLALIAAPAWAEAPDPEDAAPCNQAEVLAMMGPSVKAADLYLACAKVPGQSPYMIARSRFHRYEIFERLDKPELAEAELKVLTSPPVSAYPVFTPVASTPALNAIGRSSIGASQAKLLAALAAHRLYAKDMPAALALANRSIAAAGHDPALVFDIAAAYAVRAKLYYLDKNSDLLVKTSIRAWLRGSEDPWIIDVIKKLPAQTQTALEARRKQLRDQAGDYAMAASPQGRMTQKAADNAATLQAGKAAVADLEAFELKQLGPF